MMRVEAIFQFYLPYLLPRGEDWTGAGMGLEGPEFVGLVRPRSAEEDLFPEEIDRRLAQLTIEGYPAAVGAECLDRVEVRVVGEVASESEVRREELQRRYRDAATSACDRFLYVCRVGLRHPFIRLLQREYVLEEDSFRMLTPYSVTWLGGEEGHAMPTYGSKENARCYAERRVASRGWICMRTLAEKARAGELPSLARSLLVDAEERVRECRLREGVLGLAVACEVASNEYVRRKAVDKDPEVKEILGREGVSFAEKRLHSLPKHISGRSLKQEEPDAFEDIQNMYRARNSIMHEGELRYRKSAEWVSVDHRTAGRFVQSGWKGIDWLATL
jgi:hypothetical protein